MLAVERARSGPLRPLLAKDSELLRRQPGAPLLRRQVQLETFGGSLAAAAEEGRAERCRRRRSGAANKGAFGHLRSHSSPLACCGYFGAKSIEVTPAAREIELGSTGQADEGQTWETLLAAAQRGDKAAYRCFLGAVVPFARAIARRRLDSEDLVEDAVQDALLTIHRVRHTYRPAMPVRPWLAAIVTRRAIDVGRRRGRTGAREVHDPAAYETFADPQAKSSDGTEAAATIAGMMGELTPKQKEAIGLVKLQEMSLADASAASGQSVASLKVNVHRAIRKLRRGLTGGER